MNRIGNVRNKGTNFINPNKFKMNASIVATKNRNGRISLIKPHSSINK